MEVHEVIHEVSIQDFNIVWQKNLSKRSACPTTMTPEEQVITSYIIWALNGFNFTTLRVRYRRGGYVDIPLPANKLNYKKDYKKIQAKQLLSEIR